MDRRVFSGWIGVAGVLAALGCAERREPPNLLLIVVDTLRADHLGAYGWPRPTSPALDALAAESALFTRAYAVSPWTLPSVASIMTGVYPSKHRIDGLYRRIPPDAKTLPAFLARRGYATGGVVSHTMVSASKNFDLGFESFDEAEAQGHRHVSTTGVTERACGLLRKFAVDSRPFFLFVHYFDPHYDFMPHPEYGFAPPRAGRLDGTEDIWGLRDMLADLEAEEIRFLVDRYDEEIRFTDDGLKELLDTLQALDLDGSTLVVLTADHGEEFRDRTWLGHTTSLYEELVRVPLVVRPPGGERGGTVVPDPVSLVALAPTVLELLGFDPEPFATQAESFASRIRASQPRSDVFLEVDFHAEKKRSHRKAILRGDTKLIRDDETGTFELYDLSVDPGERRNLAPERRETVDELAIELTGFFERVGRDPWEIVRGKRWRETREALRSLGYVAAPADSGEEVSD